VTSSSNNALMTRRHASGSPGRLYYFTTVQDCLTEPNPTE